MASSAAIFLYVANTCKVIFYPLWVLISLVSWLFIPFCSSWKNHCPLDSVSWCTTGPRTSYRVQKQSVSNLNYFATGITNTSACIFNPLDCVFSSFSWSSMVKQKHVCAFQAAVLDWYRKKCYRKISYKWPVTHGDRSQRYLSASWTCCGPYYRVIVLGWLDTSYHWKMWLWWSEKNNSDQKGMRLNYTSTVYIRLLYGNLIGDVALRNP